MLKHAWRRTPKPVARLLALAVVLGLVLSLLHPIPAHAICILCSATDPCTGTVYTAGGCCPAGQTPFCVTLRDTTGCIHGVAVACH